MGNWTNVPFGPQHVILPEPVHLNFQMDDERIKNVTFKIGYCHRGIEEKMSRVPYQNSVFVAERICGICSGVHNMSCCRLYEEIIGLEVPRQAEVVRTFMAELERLHSHLLITGHLAEAVGYENIFQLSWRDRELIMDALELVSGNRVNYSMFLVGGNRLDIDAKKRKQLKSLITEAQDKWQTLRSFFLDDASLKARTKGIGVIPKDIAIAANVLGPNIRASGVPLDSRNDGYLLYKELKFKPVTEKDGDCYARMKVRVREMDWAFQACLTTLGLMEDGKEFQVKPPKVLPKNEAVIHSEAPRGELYYYGMGNGTDKAERVKIRTPTFATLRGLPIILEGLEFADVGNLIISLDPCLSCTDR